MARLHVGNLPDNCPKDSLNDLFSPYGKLTDITVIKNYGFVSFTDKDDAEKAAKDLDNTKLLGKEITVEFAKQRSSNRDKPRSFRQENNRRSNYNGNMDKGMDIGLGNPLAGILGAGPGNNTGAAPALGLLNTLTAAVAGQLEKSQLQHKNPLRIDTPNQQPDPDVRVRREVIHVRDVPQSAKLGLNSGYVIHERYYVDSSHPLLRGLPISDLPRMSDPPSRRNPAREREREREPTTKTLQDDYFNQKEKYTSSEHRERSPVRIRDFDYQRY